jgi:pantoate--beta-alanine ligase
MIRDLHFPIKMHICPTVRDENGLALSSRNAYLTPSQKKYALVLSASLRHMESLFKSGQRNASTLIAEGTQLIENARQQVESSNEDWKIKLDYVAINSAKDLGELKGDIPKEDGCVISMAVFVGKTRLIDNLCLDVQLDDD